MRAHVLLPLLLMMSQVAGYTVITMESLEAATVKNLQDGCVGDNCHNRVAETQPTIINNAGKKIKASKILDLKKYLNDKLNRANNLLLNEKFDEARKIYIDYLGESLGILKLTHIDRLRAMYFLASCLNSLGMYNQALEIENLAIGSMMEGDSKNYETNFIDTVNKKAITLIKLERYQEALDILNTVLNTYNIKKQSILVKIHNKAYSLYKSGKFKDSLVLFDKVIKKRTDILGADHLETLQSKECKADLLEKMGNNFDAWNLYYEVLQKRLEIWGDDNEFTKKSLSDMRRINYKLLKPTKERRKRKYYIDGDDLETLDLMEYTAKMMEANGDLESASDMFLEVLNRRREVYGRYDERTIQTEANWKRVNKKHDLG